MKRGGAGFYAVILSGGSGERFWPLSTPERPKQFLSLFGGKSLLRQAVERLNGLVPADRILVITASSLAKATRKELPELPRGNVISEPCRRDTAAAVATACGVVARRGGEDAVAAILTADQLMGNAAAFRRVLSDAALAAARSDSIVTLGVTPDRPATGFGYIRVGGRVDLDTKTEFHAARRFVEKPDERTARRYLASGDYVWNAGMFVWRVAVMRKALADGAPELAALADALTGRRACTDRVLKDRYPPLPRISIDYAVMEKAHNIIVSRGDFGWDDVGTWSSAARHLASDGSRNVTKGSVAALDVSDAILISEPGAPKIAALGVKDLVVVAARGSVLVADRSRVQDLKKLIAVMDGVR